MNNKEQNNSNKPRLVIPRTLLAGIAYLALVGVVIYGTTDHVYDGFGKAAPWLIGGVFLIMAAVRGYEYYLSLRAQRSVDLFDSEKDEEDGEDENASGEYSGDDAPLDRQ